MSEQLYIKGIFRLTRGAGTSIVEIRACTSKTREFWIAPIFPFLMQFLTSLLIRLFLCHPPVLTVPVCYEQSAPIYHLYLLVCGLGVALEFGRWRAGLGGSSFAWIVARLLG